MSRKTALLERLFAEHGGALQAFFRRRIRSSPDAQDLAQEVYLRMLRASDSDAIRNPEGYLYTVAINLAKEHAVLNRRRGFGIDAQDESIQEQIAQLPEFESQWDNRQRVLRLREVLAQLPPKCRAAVVLQYQEGLSYREIALRIGVSPHMVKKYLATALVHCRRRMSRLE